MPILFRIMGVRKCLKAASMIDLSQLIHLLVHAHKYKFQ